MKITKATIKKAIKDAGLNEGNFDISRYSFESNRQEADQEGNIKRGNIEVVQVCRQLKYKGFNVNIRTSGFGGYFVNIVDCSHYGR